MIYFTSDLHFNHDKSFIWEPRGFSNIYDHDREIIRRWNETVQPQDEIYFLGDVGMGRDVEYLTRCVSRLNGTIHWVLGNHDTEMRILYISELPHVILEGYATPLKYNGQRFWLSHFPTMSAPIGEKPFYKSLISLCGHTHTGDCFNDWKNYMIYHVELDAHDNCPVSIEQVMNDIRNICEPL